MTLSERVSEYVHACFTGLWIESHEHEDALVEIAKLCRKQKWQLPETVPFGETVLKPLRGGETLGWKLIDEVSA